MAFLKIDDILTKKGRKKVKVNDILRFDGGVELKIMRKNPGGVWAKRVKTYDPEVFKRHEGHDVDMKSDPMHCRKCDVDLV